VACPTLETAVEPGILHTYADPDDVFEREPFVARFQAKVGRFTFVLINIHAKPDDAAAEIYALAEVVSHARTRYPGEEDFIVLGDLNADCDYFGEEDSSFLLRGLDCTWLVGNAEDTNLAASNCTGCRRNEMLYLEWKDVDIANRIIHIRNKPGFGLSESLSLHNLRHTFASRLAQRGISLYIIAKLPGHRSVKTTEIYSHLTPNSY
jgi:integrase